jgi:hypothetical protein
MMNKLDKQLMPSAVLLFLAAVIFAGALLWHDTVGVKYSQMSQQVGAPQGAQTASPFSDVTTGEDAIPHYIAGNINGAVVSVSDNSLTMAVIPPGSTVPGSVKATVIVDPDTQIYKLGALKDSATYNQEIAAYQADPSQYTSAPQPFVTTTLTLKDLTVGEQINVLPKAGSVQGTTLHAQLIMPLDMATSTVLATQ